VSFEQAAPRQRAANRSAREIQRDDANTFREVPLRIFKKSSLIE
jgi:hypothetical protein